MSLRIGGNRAPIGAPGQRWQANTPAKDRATTPAATSPDGFDRSQPTKLKGGTYNCLIGRDPQGVGRAVKGFLEHDHLDFLQLQEISEYHGVLDKIPGYHLVTFPGSNDHGESGILVRDGIDTKSPRSIEADSGWTAITGHPAAPRAATSVKLAGWLRVTSVHQPPHIDFRDGHPVGPKARVKSYISSMEHLLAASKATTKNRPDVAQLIGGDWNEGSHSTGYGSPHWLATHGGLESTQVAPIDWEMARGAKITNMRRGPSGGSDHHLVTFTITQS